MMTRWPGHSRQLTATLALALALALASSLAPSLGRAQQPALAPGARVRVLRVGATTPQEGAFVSLDRDTLVVRPGFGSVADTIPVARVATLEVSTGVGRDAQGALRGMLIGGGVGAATGVVLVKATCNDSGEGPPCALGEVLTGAALGFAGVFLGAIAGAKRVEHWARVDPARRTSLILLPSSHGGVALGLTVAVGGGGG